jgi:6-phosphofructokinase 1
LIQNLNEENRGMCGSESISVLQAMGRKSGYITAASRLGDPHREMPLQLYTAESGHNLETLAENVNRELKRSGRCMVVVNEGFDVGNLGDAHDAFGHVEYGASQISVAQVVTNYLNGVGLKSRGQVTGQIPGVLQRSASIHASRVDIDEAYEVSKKAVEIAIEDGTGWMATILRAPGNTYRAFYDKVPLETVANSERFLPKSWLTKDGTDVTDDFIRYAMPLIGEGWPDIDIEGGLQRFARLDTRFTDKKLPAYLPQRFR